MPELKNIWVAAADGDLDRVQELVEHHSISPNARDTFTYTPMHAAASYAQIHILAYLVERGGDVNITDDDGDTPLYSVETIETAQWLIDHGAVANCHNHVGKSPIDHVQEEFPEVADFLRSKLDPSIHPRSAPLGPSQYAQDAETEQQTANLIRAVGSILQRADEEGTDPNEALREAVSSAVLDSAVAGYDLTTQLRNGEPTLDDGETKRLRMNGHHEP